MLNLTKKKQVVEEFLNHICYLEKEELYKLFQVSSSEEAVFEAIKKSYENDELFNQPTGYTHAERIEYYLTGKIREQVNSVRGCEINFTERFYDNLILVHMFEFLGIDHMKQLRHLLTLSDIAKEYDVTSSMFKTYGKNYEHTVDLEKKVEEDLLKAIFYPALKILLLNFSTKAWKWLSEGHVYLFEEDTEGKYSYMLVINENPNYGDLEIEEINKIENIIQEGITKTGITVSYRSYRNFNE